MSKSAPGSRKHGNSTVLAMCGKMGIAGDDALYRLFQQRLSEAGIGAEIYPVNAEEARRLAVFLPEAHACTLHLPRHLDILLPQHLSEIISYADTAPGKIFGLTIHDQAGFSDSLEDTCRVILELDRRLHGISQAPRAYIEYAAQLDPEFFLSMFTRTPERRMVFPCLDICHLALFFCRRHFAARHPGRDVFDFKPESPELPIFAADIQSACAQAQASTIGFLDRLAGLAGPLHFHLHDGHPASTLSRWHVSDHLSFLQKIRVPFAFNGENLLPCIFGVNGLKSLLETALARKAASELSFMVEVHPQTGRTPLGPHAGLFENWEDLTNAEQMNFWIDSILTNVDLVRSFLKTIQSPG